MVGVSTRHLTATFLVCVTLAACGGASDPPPGADEASSPVEAPAGPLDYVALGDSLATTEGGATVAYPAVYARLAEAALGRRVRLSNEAVPGITTTDLLSSLRDSSDLRGQLEKAEIITVTISGNDWEPAYDAVLAGRCKRLRCLENTLSDIEENLEAIVDELLTLRSTSETIIRFTDYFDGLIRNPVARAAGLRPRLWRDLVPTIRAWSDVTCEVAENSGIPCARTSPAFNGPDGSRSPYREGLLASDGRHLSDEGHGLMAREVAALGFEPLA